MPLKHDGADRGKWLQTDRPKSPIDEADSDFVALPPNDLAVVPNRIRFRFQFEVQRQRIAVFNAQPRTVIGKIANGASDPGRLAMRDDESR